MREIFLTQGKFALIDDDDFDRVVEHRWFASRYRTYFYALTTIKGKQVQLGAFILNTTKMVDHINGDTLDNRKENLRETNHSLNMANAKKRGTRTTSKFKGVSWHWHKHRWQALVAKDGKRYHLGYYQDEEEAAKAYDKKAYELFGDYAKLNFDRM